MYIYMYMHIHMYVCMYVFIHTWLHVRTYRYIYIYVYTYTYVHIYIYTYLYIYIDTYTYTYVYTCISIYVYMYICIYIYIYIYIHYIYTHVYTLDWLLDSPDASDSSYFDSFQGRWYWRPKEHLACPDVGRGTHWNPLRRPTSVVVGPATGRCVVKPQPSKLHLFSVSLFCMQTWVVELVGIRCVIQSWLVWLQRAM